MKLSDYFLSLEIFVFSVTYAKSPHGVAIDFHNKQNLNSFPTLSDLLVDESAYENDIMRKSAFEQNDFSHQHSLSNLEISHRPRNLSSWTEVPQKSLSIAHLNTLKQSVRKDRLIFGLREEMTQTVTDKSLERLLDSIIGAHLRDCEFIIITDKSFQGSKIHQRLLGFPNLKQTVLLQYLSDLAHGVNWKSPRCQGAFILLSDVKPLVEFGNSYLLFWSFFAKVIILGLDEESLTDFAQSKKGKKTQHVLGIVKGNSEDHLKIYMNLLFWGDGVVQISNWRNDSFVGEVTLFPNKVTNLRQAPLKVGVFEWLPGVFYQRDAKGNLVLRYGRDTAVVEALSGVYNFTIQYVEMPGDEIFGSLLPNGSFNGLVGFLEKDEGHMGIANLYAAGVDNRNRVQDYSHHIAEDKGCFLARVEPPLPRWQNPSLPFQVVTWMAFFVSFMLAGPVFYLLISASAKLGFEEPGFTSFPKLNLYTFGIHFSHPMNVLPKSSGMQVFTLFLWLYSLIITTGYTSNLIAFLTVSRDPKIIETIEELAESGLKVITLPFYASQMKTSDNPHLRALVKNIDARFDFEGSLDEVLAGRAVELNNRDKHETFGPLITTSKGKVLVRILKECFSDARVTIGFPVNSPLKPTFNNMIASLFESGVIKLWFAEARKYYEELSNQKGDRVFYHDDWFDVAEGLVPLGMDHMQGIFIVFFFGCVLSTFTFVSEVIVG